MPLFLCEAGGEVLHSISIAAGVSAKRHKQLKHQHRPVLLTTTFVVSLKIFQTCQLKRIYEDKRCKTAQKQVGPRCEKYV